MPLRLKVIIPVRLQAHRGGEVAAQPEAGAAPVGIEDVEVVHGDVVPARVRWWNAVSAVRRPVLGSPLARRRTGAPIGLGQRDHWCAPLPVWHTPGEQCLHPRLEVLGELGKVLQRPLLVRVRALPEVHDRSGLWDRAQRPHPQATDAVIPASQLLFAEFTYAVHAVKSTILLSLPLGDRSLASV